MSGSLAYSGPQTTAKKAIEDQGLPFLKEDQHTDTIFLIEGRRLYLNRALLGMASPKFQKMLDSAHKTAVSEKKSKAEIRIAEKNFSDFVDLLAFVHPGVCRDLTEKMALRLLPLSHEYEMAALKERCERVLISALKNVKFSNIKGPPQQRNRRDNTPEILLKCIKAADQGSSKNVLGACLKLFANPEIPLKDLKSSSDISDETKSKIFENRLDNAAHKINRVANDLDRTRQEKETIKKQLKDRYVSHNRNAFGYVNYENPTDKVDKSIEIASARGQPTSQAENYNSRRRISDRERKQIQHMVNAINTPRV